MSLRSIVRGVNDGICGTLNPKSESQEALLEKHYQDLTFSTSVKHCELGPKDETIKCFIKRDKSNNTYHLFLSLSSSLLDENGEFLLSTKRIRGVTYTEYAISMDPDNTSRSIIGTMRSNILGSKFTIYDSTLAGNNSPILPRPYPNHRLSKKVSTKYKIANVTYECNVFGTRGPRKMHCIMHSNVPLVMINKSPRWHGKLKGWCLNFKGRATVASVKNFQLAQSPCGDEPLPLQPGKLDHDEIILQFGKVGKDMFTMDYRYPLSAFQAFAICLSSFDTKLICE